MEKDIAFDLNERLQQWRSALRNRPAIREADIEELESHLSDTMDVLLKNGLSQEEAFLVGVRRVGHPVALEDQFRCARPAAVWKERAQWMVLGIFLLWVVSGLTKVGSSLTLWLGGRFSGNGLALGWTSLAVQALLILGLGWLIGSRITRDIRPLAARWIIYLSVGTTGQSVPLARGCKGPANPPSQSLVRLAACVLTLFSRRDEAGEALFAHFEAGVHASTWPPVSRRRRSRS